MTTMLRPPSAPEVDHALDPDLLARTRIRYRPNKGRWVVERRGFLGWRKVGGAHARTPAAAQALSLCQATITIEGADLCKLKASATRSAASSTSKAKPEPSE